MLHITKPLGAMWTPAAAVCGLLLILGLLQVQAAHFVENDESDGPAHGAPLQRHARQAEEGETSSLSAAEEETTLSEIYPSEDSTPVPEGTPAPEDSTPDPGESSTTEPAAPAETTAAEVTSEVTEPQPEERSSSPEPEETTTRPVVTGRTLTSRSRSTTRTPARTSGRPRRTTTRPQRRTTVRRRPAPRTSTTQQRPIIIIRPRPTRAPIFVIVQRTQRPPVFRGSNTGTPRPFQSLTSRRPAFLARSTRQRQSHELGTTRRAGHNTFRNAPRENFY